MSGKDRLYNWDAPYGVGLMAGTVFVGIIYAFARDVVPFAIAGVAIGGAFLTVRGTWALQNASRSGPPTSEQNASTEQKRGE